MDPDATGDIFIRIWQSTINTEADRVYGIHAQHTGAGDLTITLEQGSEIDTMGQGAHAIHVRQREGDGEAEINLEQGADIGTTGEGAAGVYLNNASSDVNVMRNAVVTVNGSIIKTTGSRSHAIWNTREGNGGMGDSRTDVRNSTITTMGNKSFGIYGYLYEAIGDIDILVQGGSVTTQGLLAHGIYAKHQKIGEDDAGDIDIDVRNATITTESTDLDPDILATYSLGIFARHDSTGDITIDAQGGGITTKGVYSYGIYGLHQGDGDIAIDTRDGNTITTTGDNAHGIVAYHYGTEESRTIDITVGGSVEAGGAGAHGVRVGVVNAEGEAERVAAVGADGYLQQTVRVNGRVSGGTGEAAGVFLAGGGRVYIGPAGTVGAESGIAVLATGDTPVDGADPIKPKLLVDMNLDGRRVAEVIGDDWIINDGGETTIVVNDVKLHDGATGVVPDASAPNGAFDVTVKDDGRTVTDRSTSPWTISQRSTSTIADRDFSAEDFTETMPPPPMCPPGQVGTPPDCTTPPSQQTTTEVEVETMTVVETTTEPETDVKPMPPTFMEEYAPRAAVYEAMPGFLLRIDAPELSEKRIAWADSPVWARLSGGRGSYEPERASVGAQFDYSRFAAEAGLYVSLGKNATGSVSVRHVKGSADVSAPTGGGKIEAEGLGFSLGASLNSANDYYARGRISLTNYSVDLSSDALGSLKNGVGASVNSLDLEAGKRMRPDGNIRLTPRVWMTRSTLDVDDFTDTVDARVSLGDAVRLVGGAGVVGENALDWLGGALTLRGSVDLALTFGGAETSVEISGTKLSSEALKSRLLLGLGGTYRRGSFFLDAEVSVGGPSSGDAQYSGRVTYGWEF